LIAAVSGGSDSVALLVLLHDLHERGNLTLVAIAHLHHGIRGNEADEDQRFCEALAADLDVPLEVAHADVPALARRDRVSLEVAGRRARHDFFRSVITSRSADRVATAHTEDDQAETVLFRMIRGAGLRGLSGMAPSRGHLVRPLLECSRRSLREELTRRHRTWRDDSTNLDLANPRNRLRHEVLPLLERHFNPSVRRAFSRFAEQARADETCLSRTAAAATATAVRIDGDDGVRLDASAVRGLPGAITSRVVQHALALATGGKVPDADQVAAVLAVLTGEAAGAEILGVRAEHSAGSVVLVRSGSAEPRPFRFNLSVPGAVHAPDLTWVLEAEGPQAHQSERHITHSADTVAVDAKGLSPTLVVRSRKPGDRIQPLGLNGRKKLQDVFVDRKVGRDERDRVPVVTDDRGRIVWVAGHVLSEEFRITDETKAVIILKLRRRRRLGR
jgi:tRNA(Ile)-lysidine synthase